MLRLLERDPHGQRLRDLLARFRTQELDATARLEDLQLELESVHRESSFRAIAKPDGPATLQPLCIEMQLECDQLATELVHVRMAVAGACEELAEHDRRRFLESNQPLSTTA